MKITRKKLNEVIRQYLINEAEAVAEKGPQKKFRLPGISGELEIDADHLKDPQVEEAFEDLTSQEDDEGLMKSLRAIAELAKPGVQTHSALLASIMQLFHDKSKKHLDMAERDDVINKAHKAEMAWRNKQR